MIKKCCFIVAFLFSYVASQAQQLNIPLTPVSDIQYLYEISSDKNAFTSLKPLLDSRVRSLNYDSIAFNKNKGKTSWFVRKLLSESFIVIDTGDLKLSIDPLIDVGSGKGILADKNSKLFTNSRGLAVRGDITERFSFETTFLESQTFFPAYISATVKSLESVPGYGRAKPFKVSGYDYAFGSGYISWTPSKLFNLQMGHGKHFVGEGYRSLLLSDNAFNYPYIKPSFQYKWIKYDVIYSSLMIMKGGKIPTTPFTEPVFRKKPATFHLLSFKPLPFFEFGLFEGTIFNAETPGKPEEFNFVNPLIFANSISYGLNHSKHNVLTGATFTIRPVKYVTIYGQLVNDGSLPTVSKTGYQAGATFQNSFMVLRGEYDVVEPFTYTSANSFQSYTHYNQPLAHTWGSAVNEVVASASFKLIKRLILSSHVSTGKVQFIGGSVFTSDTVLTGPGSLASNPLAYRQVTYVKNSIEYVANPVTNLSIYAELTTRFEKYSSPSTYTNRTVFVFAGIRTNLFRSYRDF